MHSLYIATQGIPVCRPAKLTELPPILDRLSIFSLFSHFIFLYVHLLPYIILHLLLLYHNVCQLNKLEIVLGQYCNIIITTQYLIPQTLSVSHVLYVLGYYHQ